MTKITDDALAKSDQLTWARGTNPTEAATQLLFHAFGGRFARPGWPWVASTESGRHYIDATKLTDNEIGMLSGGERRALAFARSLLGEDPVDLSDAITGLDRRHTRLVIDALAHAAGERGYRPVSTDPAHGDMRVPIRNECRRPSSIEPTGMTR